MNNPEYDLPAEWRSCYPEMPVEKAQELRREGSAPLFPSEGVVCGTCYFHQSGSIQETSVRFHGCSAQTVLQVGEPIHLMSDQIIPKRCPMGFQLKADKTIFMQRTRRALNTFWKRIH